MPQSPKTTSGYHPSTPTIKAEMEAQSLSANSTNNNNTIFTFPSVPTSSSDDKSSRVNNNNNSDASMTNQFNNAKRHEGKQLDVNDVNVNVNVVASSTHDTVSTSSSYSLSSSDNPSTNTTNQSSSNLNVVHLCDGGSVDKTNNTGHGIIITESHDAAAGGGYYDAIKLEESSTTAIIYETIVIENPSSTTTGGGNQELALSFNNNKLMANKNVSALENGGIIVLTGSLNDLLLGQSGHVITSTNISQSSNGAGANIKCLNDVKTNPNHIQSIVLNLNSQSSASATGMGANAGGQKSIMLAINPNQQVSFSLPFHIFAFACQVKIVLFGSFLNDAASVVSEWNYFHPHKQLYTIIRLI
jgi:hypothetical protein